MNKVLIILAAIMAFWVGVFIFARFAPSESELLLRYAAWSKYSAVSLPANFTRELPFPIPTAVLSLVTPMIPISIFWFRSLNLGLALIWLVLAYKLLGKNSKGTAYWFLVFATTSLWIIWTLMTSLPTAITMVLVFGILVTEQSENEHKDLISAFLGLWLAETSVGGWIFLIIFWIFKLIQKIDLKVFCVGLFIIGYSFLTAVKPYYTLNFANTALTIDSNIGARVDQRVRYETKLNNYQEPLPLIIKRVVYNKPYFVYREITQKIGALFSLEKWSFPGQGDATVTRNLWGSKNLGWIAWWLVPLAIFSLTGWKNKSKQTRTFLIIFGVWGISGLILGGGDFLENGIGIDLAIIFAGAELITYSKPIVKIITGFAVILVTIPTFHHFINHEDIWRDNRPKVFLSMAQSATKYKAGQVTTILGRTFLYYGWINQMTPQEFWKGVQVGMKIGGVKFDHFEKPDHPGVYIGLPGEFLGSKAKDQNNNFTKNELPDKWTLLEEQKIKDTVSFGNGDYIWAVKVN